MELVTSLIGGLLGGGVAGAIIGGLVTLWAQRRQFDRERQTRFIDLKRQRYAELVRGGNEWARLLNNQRANAFAAIREKRSVDTKPELPETTDLWHIANEVTLLNKEVGHHATAMVGAVVLLGPFGVDVKNISLLDHSLAPYSEALEDFNLKRDAFLEVARRDLET